MAKKVTKKKKPPKQKIDVVLESLLNLERRMKELISHVEQLRYSQSRFKDIECVELKMSEEQKENFKKLYLETITKDWIYSRLIVGLDEMGLPIFMDSWHHKHDIKFTQEQVDDTIITK